jgi:predicted dehydrogenase
MATQLLSAAVVGAGLMGRWHARELVRVGGRLVAVVDPDREAGAELATKGARWFPTLDAMLGEVEADVVHVCAPSEHHEQLVETALAAGSHALVEKPLAPDAAATRRLLDHAEREGRLLGPVHQYLYQRGVLEAPRRLAALGALVQLDVCACSAGGTAADGDQLDGVALDIAPHGLAVLERILPGGLASLQWDVRRPLPGELRAYGEAGPTGVSLAVSLGGRPPRNELRAICEGGTLELDFFHGFGYVERGDLTRRYKTIRPFAAAAARIGSAAGNLARRTAGREPAYPGLRTLIERFYSAVAAGGPSPISAEETIAVALARDRLVDTTPASP